MPLGTRWPFFAISGLSRRKIVSSPATGSGGSTVSESDCVRVCLDAVAEVVDHVALIDVVDRQLAAAAAVAQDRRVLEEHLQRGAQRRLDLAVGGDEEVHVPQLAGVEVIRRVVGEDDDLLRAQVEERRAAAEEVLEHAGSRIGRVQLQEAEHYPIGVVDRLLDRAVRLAGEHVPRSREADRVQVLRRDPVRGTSASVRSASLPRGQSGG